jgi:anti-sigma28 factor (negative regulator of flagellin synthesis)
MKVPNVKEVRGVERIAQRDEGVKQPPSPPLRHEDRVTIEGNQVAEQLNSFKLRAVPGRTARLEQLESAIKAGQYQPDASQLAEKLLSAAEIDARLRALMRG